MAYSSTMNRNVVKAFEILPQKSSEQKENLPVLILSTGKYVCTLFIMSHRIKRIEAKIISLIEWNEAFALPQG